MDFFRSCALDAFSTTFDHYYSRYSISTVASLVLFSHIKRTLAEQMRHIASSRQGLQIATPLSAARQHQPSCIRLACLQCRTLRCRPPGCTSRHLGVEPLGRAPGAGLGSDRPRLARPRVDAHVRVRPSSREIWLKGRIRAASLLGGGIASRGGRQRAVTK
jgi:hypothetical protein